MTRPRAPLLAALLQADSAMPSGSFAFSWGLEALYEDGTLDGTVDFADVLCWYLTTRWVSFDRFFVDRSWGATSDERIGLDRQCTAATTGAAARQSGVRAGRAMLLAWSRLGVRPAEEYLGLVRSGGADGNLPVVQGLIFACCGVERDVAHAVSGWTFMSNIASAAVRMGHVGALASQAALVRALDHLGDLLESPVPPRPNSWGLIQDIAMEHHALRTSRLFAS